MTKRYLLILSIFLFAGAAFADIARPTATPGKQKAEGTRTRLLIRLDPDAKDPRLIIPRDELKAFAAQAGSLDPAAGSAISGGGALPVRTIVAGGLLSLAIFFVGIWVFRSKKFATKATKAAVSAAAVLTLASFAGLAYANIAPPTETRFIRGSIFSPAIQKYKYVSGSIVLEVSDEPGANLEMIVPDPQPSPSPAE